MKTSTHANMSDPVHTSSAAPVVVRGVDLHKAYGTGASQVNALDGCNVSIRAGQFTAVMGPSGSGKSTLMHCLAGLDRPTSGQVFLDDTELSVLNDRRLTDVRRDQIGFIFQSFNLVPTLTAAENITLPSDLARRPVDRAWLDTLISEVGLQSRLGHFPSQLSGGQQQRVACARALVNRPKVIFADEPTGNLDTNAGLAVLRLLRESVDSHGQTVVMVTHDPVAAAQCDRVIFLVDGRPVDEIVAPTTDRVLRWMSQASATAGR